MSWFELFVEAVEATTGRQGRKAGSNIRLLCPAHDDQDPSLDVAEGEDGRPLVVCRSHGCTFEEVCRAIGRAPHEFMPSDQAEWTPVGPPVAIYDYVDEHGQLLFQVVRSAGKQFRQRVPDPSSRSGWRWKLGSVRRVLYRLPEVVAAVAAGETVYVCEGEKDVDSLTRLGVTATCNPGGAGKWRDEYSESLGGASVVVVADRDEAGYAHARSVAAAVEGIASSVTVAEPAEGKDLTDHLSAGFAVDDLVPVSADVGSPARPRRTQAGHLLDLAMGAELFHTSSGEPFATFPVREHRETWSLRSKQFRNWLSKQLYDRDGTIPTAAARNDALTVLEGTAAHDSPMTDVHVRLAADEDVIYLDLGNSDWEVVKLDGAGWKIDPTPPVRFRRSASTLELPHPTRGGSIDELRPFVNVDQDGWILFVSWLVSCLRPQGPYPVLNLLGEQGAAKSTAARIARALVDPNRAPLRTSPRNPHDFILTATNSWVTALDNLSALPEWLSDALCRLSTGGGYVTRALYTDSDEVIFDAQRPVILTGISELATRSDLLDRSLLITLPNIPEEARLAEKEFWASFRSARPSILGALLDATTRALQDESSVSLPRLPRMADFALWSAAAAPAFGWETDDFIRVYEANRSAVHEIAIDDSPIGPALLEVATAGFEGTATELLAKLGALVAEAATKERGWPKTARALSGTLRRLAPNLRALGIEVSFMRETTGQKRRLVTLRSRRGPVTPVTGATGLATALAGGGVSTDRGDENGAAEPDAGRQLGLSETPPSEHGDEGDASDETHRHAPSAEEEAEIERLLRKHSDLFGGDAT